MTTGCPRTSGMILAVSQGAKPQRDALKQEQSDLLPGSVPAPDFRVADRVGRSVLSVSEWDDGELSRQPSQALLARL